MEYLDCSVDFVATNPDKDQIQQMYIYKDIEFKKQVATVSLVSACRVNMIFENVCREEEYLLSALIHFLSNL